MNDVVRILHAAEFAAEAHANQRRKGANGEPYLNHLIEVASLAAEATGGDVETVVAALLHDTIEDTKVGADDLVRRFGREVADIVLELTDDKSLPKEERKRLQAVNAPHKSAKASVVKLCDKTSNLRALASSPPPWPLERKRAYLEWARSVVSGLPHKPARLLAEFERAAAAAEAAMATVG